VPGKGVKYEKRKRRLKMRKEGVLMLAAVLLLAVTVPGIQAAEKHKPAAKAAPAAQYQYAPAKAAKSEGISAAGWALLGGDAALAGLSVFFLLDERSAAASYTTLYNNINNTTLANYDLLNTKKKDIDGKLLMTELSSGVAAAAVLYTVADVLFIHAVFPASTKLSYDPGNKAIKLSVSRGF
jgi:hypothetical protein